MKTNNAPQNKKLNKKMKRKEFIKSAGRLLIFGGFTASASYLIINKKVSANCSVSPTCENCRKVASCENPEVKEERNGKEK